MACRLTVWNKGLPAPKLASIWINRIWRCVSTTPPALDRAGAGSRAREVAATSDTDPVLICREGRDIGLTFGVAAKANQHSFPTES